MNPFFLPRQTHSLSTLREAVEFEEGFCLKCGTRQEGPSQDDRFPLGQCCECNYYAVLSAETLLQAVTLLEGLEEAEEV